MKRTILLSILLATSLMSCRQNALFVNKKVFCFDTMVDMKLYDGNNEDALNISRLLNYYHQLTDRYESSQYQNPYSINKTNDEVTVEESLYNLLKASVDVKNEGAIYFNPLCGSLSDEWKFTLKKQQIPAENVINYYLEQLNSSSILFKEDNIIQRLGQAEIDLGGIAKGYALDRVQDYLIEHNRASYIVDAGSSSILLGKKPTKDGLYTVGLKDVDGAYIKTKNCFVSTSSKSVQGVEIDGVTYSHIINPITGSAINENDAVIVISDKGYYGDVMSTSMMMNTIDEIKEIEKEHNIRTIVIKDNKIVYKNEEIEVYYH